MAQACKKAIERYHTKAYVLPNAAKEAPRLQQRCFDFAPITAPDAVSTHDKEGVIDYGTVYPRSISPTARKSPSSKPKGDIFLSSARRRRRPHPRRQLRGTGSEGLLRRPEVPPLRARLRHPFRAAVPTPATSIPRRLSKLPATRGWPWHGWPGLLHQSEEFTTNPNNSH